MRFRSGYQWTMGSTRRGSGSPTCRAGRCTLGSGLGRDHMDWNCGRSQPDPGRRGGHGQQGGGDRQKTPFPGRRGRAVALDSQLIEQRGFIVHEPGRCLKFGYW